MSNITLELSPKEDINELRQALKGENIKYSERMFFRDDVSSPITILGELVFSKEVALSAIGLVGGWIAGRQGRKVKLKTSTFEAEAHNVDELQKVLALLEKADPSDNAPPSRTDPSTD
jgi:hypothetical protein